jgi:ketosteroid isomerase-like protein
VRHLVIFFTAVENHFKYNQPMKYPSVWHIAIGLALSIPLPVFAQLSPTERFARRESLVAADRAAGDSVLKQGFASGLAGMSAAELVLVYPGAPVIAGLEAVKAMLAEQKALTTITVRWMPLTVELSNDGTFGLTYGVTAISADAANPSDQLRMGKYLSAWRRVGSEWRMVAHAQSGLLPASSYEMPEKFTKPAFAKIPGGNPSDFAAADAEFAALAAREGAPRAFATYVAPDGVIFSGSGELIRGPEPVRAQMADGPQAVWKWWPVAAGSSSSGDLGFTVGEAIITPSGSPATYSKYLSLWRRGKDGKIRFIADGGNARPAE